MPDLRKKARVVVVDDDLALAETLADGLSDLGYDAIAIGSSREASQQLASEDVDALVTDLRMPGVDGLDLLALSRKAVPERPVIVMTAYSAVDTAIESIRRGAYHYLTKPFKVNELALFLSRALDDARVRREALALKRALRQQFAAANIVGHDGTMRDVCDLAERVADAPTPVLLTGETGTGKGLIAGAIHGSGARASGPFVTVNCAAVPEALLETELFGHLKGAFTGALTPRKGLFAEASGGTLFLDEIGEMPLGIQAKLLHVLERGIVRAVGSDKERPVDVRIVAASNRDLKARVREGAFREDLLFRLDVVRIEIPPLRLRRADIPALIGHFLALAHARHPQSPVRGFSPAALTRMLEYRWPGNVRELGNMIERAVLLGRTAEVDVGELPESIRTRSAARMRFDGEILPLAEFERDYVRWAFEQLGGRKVATAEKLDIDRKTLNRILGEQAAEVAD